MSTRGDRRYFTSELKKPTYTEKYVEENDYGEAEIFFQIYIPNVRVVRVFDGEHNEERAYSQYLYLKKKHPEYKFVKKIAFKVSVLETYYTDEEEEECQD